MLMYKQEALEEERLSRGGVNHAASWRSFLVDDELPLDLARRAARTAETDEESLEACIIVSPLLGCLHSDVASQNIQPAQAIQQESDDSVLAPTLGFVNDGGTLVCHLARCAEVCDNANLAVIEAPTETRTPF